MLRTDVSFRNHSKLLFLASQGKLSRQVANLKQTLKHTTDNTMQLDTTMEQRRREIQNISGDINNERDYNE